MTKDHEYLYPYSAQEAKKRNQLSMWRESYHANIACRNAIEETIRQNFDGMRGGFLPLRKEDAGANSHSAGPDQCPALRAAAPLCGGAPPPRMLSYDGARK